MNKELPIKALHTTNASNFTMGDALGVAQRNAITRIIRCVFAENIIDPERLECSSTDRSALLALSNGETIWFEALRQAPANTFVNAGYVRIEGVDGDWRVITDVADLIDALLPEFDFDPADAGAEKLKGDIQNSIENDALARQHRAGWNAALRSEMADAGVDGLIALWRKTKDPRTAAILLDQWGSLEGHPFYPTWKTKPNLSSEEVRDLSPEFAAEVPVRLAAIRSDMAHVELMAGVTDVHAWIAHKLGDVYGQWRGALEAKGLSVEDYLPLPIHSWHLEHHVKTHFADLISDDILIVDGPDIPTRPSMSFRTMLPVDAAIDPFIKLPVAIWLTSELRSLQAKSIHMGPRSSTVISQILARENGFDNLLEFFTEDIGIHYKHATRQDDAEGKLLSVIFRSTNALLDRRDGLLPVTVAALLTKTPDGNRPLIAEMVDQACAADGTLDVSGFFRRYVQTVLKPVLQIYMLYGIALEAHQQNTSILFDDDGNPVRMLIRDFGDGRTFAPLLNAQGLELKSYYYKGILPTVFDDDIEPVRSFVIDACYVCHLHEVAMSLTSHYGLDDDRLWQVMREETERVFDQSKARVGDDAFWQEERETFLEAGWSTRSVLRMHLQKYADYRVQHQLPNPMRGEANS
ncbi:MAG: IucA/IucC family protein [Thalassospira sp.]|uniref:IucA/IucC family protein n=1 Tax=Thalassospira sp. TaxID=1912094 RepID=UPI003A847E69